MKKEKEKLNIANFITKIAKIPGVKEVIIKQHSPKRAGIKINLRKIKNNSGLSVNDQVFDKIKRILKTLKVDYHMSRDSIMGRYDEYIVFNLMK